MPSAVVNIMSSFLSHVTLTRNTITTFPDISACLEAGEVLNRVPYMGEGVSRSFT